MGDWDEFGDGSDFSDTAEALDSFDESSFETAESMDILSTMDAVEPIESDMDFLESSLDMDDTASEYSVMDSVEAMPVEFDDMLADGQMQEAQNAETDIQESVESTGDSYETNLADNNALSLIKEIEVPQVEFDDEPNETGGVDNLEQVYEATPNSELEIIQEDGTIDTLENIQNRVESTEDLSQEVTEQIYEATPNSELEIIQEDGTVDTLENIQNRVESIEDLSQEVTEQVYEVTPNSELEIIQEDGTVDTLENIQNRVESTEDLSQEVTEQIYEATPNSELEVIQEDGTVDILENIQNRVENTEEKVEEIYEEDAEELNEMRPIDELRTWLEEINPNFAPFDIDSPYCNNCGSCAYAVYQRLEGNNNICATAENIGYNDEMEALTGMEQIAMSPAEIEARLLEQGDGSHAIIGIDRAVGPGHWFNAANIGGKVIAIDGQTGEINDWPPDYGNVVNWEMSVKKEI